MAIELFSGFYVLSMSLSLANAPLPPRDTAKGNPARVGTVQTPLQAPDTES